MGKYQEVVLDDWQEELADQAVEMILGLPAKQVRHIINVPTGGGKTEIAIVIVHKILEQWPEKYSQYKRNPITCSWLSERTILRNETAGRLQLAGLKVRDATKKPRDQRMLMQGVVNMLSPQTFVERNRSGFDASVILGEDNGDGEGEEDFGDFDPFADVDEERIQLVEKVVRHKRGKRPMAYERTLGEWGVLIADEAHHSAADFYGSCVRAWPGPVIGLTATSWLLSDKMGLGEDTSVPYSNGKRRLSGPFLTISYGPGPRELCGTRLSDVVYAEINPRLTVKEWNLEATDLSADGYTPQSVDKEVSRMLAVGQPIVQEWKRLADKPCLWFCRSKAAAHEVARLFGAAGYTSGVVLAETPEEERRELLDALAAGKLTCLASVDVFGEGVNVPSVNCVAMLRPTCSLTKHLQFLGRGMRMRPDGSPLLVLDFADNVSRLGSPMNNRNEKQFGLVPRDKYPSSGGFGGAHCPDCEAPCIWSQSNCHNPNCRRPLSWTCEGATMQVRDPFNSNNQIQLEVPGHQVREWCGRYKGKNHAVKACDRAIEEAVRAYRYAHEDRFREEEEARIREIQEAERVRLAEENKLREIAEAKARRRKALQGQWDERKALVNAQKRFLNAEGEVDFSARDISWIRVPNPTDMLLWVPLVASSVAGEQPFKMVAIVKMNGKIQARIGRAPISQTLDGVQVEIGNYTATQLADRASVLLYEWGLKRGRVLRRINTHRFGDGTDPDRNIGHVDFTTIR